MTEFSTHVTEHANGTYALGVSINQGFMTPDDFIMLADLAKKYHVTTLMPTTAKKIQFLDVAEENVNPLYADIQAAFGSRLRTPKGKIIVCPGTNWCKFAVKGRDNYDMGLKIEEISKKHDAGKVKVGVACCPKSCPMVKVRDIGLFPTADGWTVMVGGNGAFRLAVAETLAKNLTEEEALALIDRIYAYLEENKDGKERSARTVERLGIDSLKAAVLA